jgi:hypothetical protein
MTDGAEVDFGSIDRDHIVGLVRDIEAAIDEHDEVHAAEVIVALLTVLSREVRNVDCPDCRGLAAVTARGDSLSDSLAEEIVEYGEVDESDVDEHIH